MSIVESPLNESGASVSPSHTDGVKRLRASKVTFPLSLSPPWERAGVRGRREARRFFPLTLTLSHQERELKALTPSVWVH